jgi:hypothetical protein
MQHQRQLRPSTSRSLCGRFLVKLPLKLVLRDMMRSGSWQWTNRLLKIAPLCQSDEQIEQLQLHYNTAIDRAMRRGYIGTDAKRAYEMPIPSVHLPMTCTKAARNSARITRC